MTSIYEEKISAEVQLIHVEQMSLHNFIVLEKTIDTTEDWTTEGRHFKLMEIYGLF